MFQLPQRGTTSLAALGLAGLLAACAGTGGAGGGSGTPELATLSDTTPAQKREGLDQRYASDGLVIGGALALVGVVAGLVIWRRKRADKRRKR